MRTEFKRAGERMPRNKYRDLDRDRLVYAKMRKKTHAKTQKLRKRLLKLLDKLIAQWNRFRKLYPWGIMLSAGQEKRLSAILKVRSQQHELLEKKEVHRRVVSIDRLYIRPIVRGKENKRVEFGAKVNNIQIDGISFIEHHSFEAFNEGVRLKQCIEYQKELTGIDVKEIGADTIYANNENRKYCTENGITTCFARKVLSPRIRMTPPPHRAESSATSAPLSWRAVLETRNCIMASVASPHATPAARPCCCSSGYTWPMRQSSRRGNGWLRKKKKRKPDGHTNGHSHFLDKNRPLDDQRPG